MSQPLSRTLAKELLDRAKNPDHSNYNDFDDDDPEPEVISRLLLYFCLGLQNPRNVQSWKVPMGMWVD